MKRAFALAAVLSFFGTAALAECPGHVSASAPPPSSGQQTSDAGAPASGQTVTTTAQTGVPAGASVLVTE